MGIFEDLAMGLGIKDRNNEYYQRTAATMGRASQGGSAEQEAMYRSQMGLNDGASVENGRLPQKSLLGKVAIGFQNAVGGKGGGKVENPVETIQSVRPQIQTNPYSGWTGNQVGMGGGTEIPLSEMDRMLSYEPNPFSYGSNLPTSEQEMQKRANEEQYKQGLLQ